MHALARPTEMVFQYRYDRARDASKQVHFPSLEMTSLIFLTRRGSVTGNALISILGASAADLIAGIVQPPRSVI